MSVRSFAICLMITLLAVLGALMAIFGHDNNPLDQEIGRPVFTQLAANPQAVKRIELRHHKGGFSFIRDQQSWRSEDKFGFPASARRVDGLLNDLAGLRLAEPKTRKPERYARIGVEPIGQAGARGGHLRLYDTNGDLIADAIIGDRISRPTGDAKAGTFVRLTGQAQAWLASGAITLPLTLRPWLNAAVIDMTPATVAAVDIIDLDGRRMVSRKTPMHSFTVAAGGGRETAFPAAPQVVEQLLTALQPLRFDDVRPRQAGPAFVATAGVKVRRFDGVVIEIEIADEKDIAWIRLNAVPPAGNVSAAISAEVAALNNRFKSWTYQIADWINDRLTEPLDRLRQQP